MKSIKGKKIILFAITSLFAAILIFWITGIIPSLVAQIYAEKYVESKYNDRNFKFHEVWWDEHWDCYFVSFIDESGNTFCLKMSKYVPVTVMYDPLDPPG